MEYIAGRQPLLEALKAGLPLKKIYLAESLQGKAAEQVCLLARQQGIPVENIPRRQLDRMVSTDLNHQGMLAQAEPLPNYTPSDLLARARKLQETPFILLLDHLQGPFNLGNLIRTAAGLGVHGVVIPKRRSADLTPAAAKGAAGALSWVPVARVGSLAQALNYFQQEGLWAVGAEAGAGKPFYELDYKMPLVLLLGGEDKGLSRLLKERCDFLTHLPMEGKINSFNVSVAGALIMYEVYRQRKGWVK